MIFLKRFQATGFKSFASPIDLSFVAPMTGVVGPNGAGKSNIVDAIKWVMGEQSLKSLRGKVGEDVIFHGAKGRNEADFAQIRLTFDNSLKTVPTMGDSFTIARKATRDEPGQYFINDEPSRLRDIQALFLDTGLSKGSLGIISQGTVQWFAEAKPEDRRRIFEEAASIGKYTKLKVEAVGRLELSSADVNRISDLVIELGKDLKRLEKQAEKAQKFAEMTKQLANVEVGLLVNDIQSFSKSAEAFRSKQKSLSETIQGSEGFSEDQDKKLAVFRQQEQKADTDVAFLTAQLEEVNGRLNLLQTKQALQSQQLDIDLSSLDKGKRAEALATKIANLQADLLDRKQRLSKNAAELAVYRQTRSDTEGNVASLTQKISLLEGELASLRAKKQISEDRLASSSHLFDGVRTVMEHKQRLYGINDIFINLIKFDERHGQALTTALGNAQQNIVVDTDQAAVEAVEFLRKNRSGTATFLPLDTIKPRAVAANFLTVLKGMPGFVGIGSALVKYDPKHDAAVRALLGGLIVAQDGPAAISLARHTYQTYRVVSLEGDLVAPGGAITGGYRRNDNSAQALRAEISAYSQRIDLVEKQLADLKEQVVKISVGRDSSSSMLTERQIMQVRLEEFIKTANEELAGLQHQYSKLTGKNVDASQLSPDQIVEQKNGLQARLDKISAELRTAREAKILYSSRVKEVTDSFVSQKSAFAAAQAELTKVNVELTRALATIENATVRLAEGYRMTFEAALESRNGIPLAFSPDDARSLVARLKRDIESLGPINAEAVSEFETKKAHYDEMAKQQSDLIHARNAILQSIQEMDEQAIAGLKKVVTGINEQLPEIFKYLFGGGSCVIAYSDPERVLESGIEVLANPPGKTVNNLNLLSGGEKTLVALAVLFAILRVKNFPLVILDEAESALDPANVERFGEIVHANSSKTQFVVITHRPGTMERCDALFGATMQEPGVTKMVSVTLSQAENYASKPEDLL